MIEKTQPELAKEKEKEEKAFFLPKTNFPERKAVSLENIPKKYRRPTKKAREQWLEAYVVEKT